VIAIAGSIVDWKAIGEVIVVSALAGVGVTLAFSLSILGADRFTQTRRDGRLIAAGAFGLLAAISLAASIGAVVFGIYGLISK